MKTLFGSILVFPISCDSQAWGAYLSLGSSLSKLLFVIVFRGERTSRGATPRPFVSTRDKHTWTPALWSTNLLPLSLVLLAKVKGTVGYVSVPSRHKSRLMHSWQKGRRCYASRRPRAYVAGCKLYLTWPRSLTKNLFMEHLTTFLLLSIRE